MRNFERTYLMHRASNSPLMNTIKNSSSYSITDSFNSQKKEMAMLLEYRELDRLVMELEKELQAVRTLRAEMEKYKVDFNMKIEDEATNKIQEVINRIDKMFT